MEDITKIRGEPIRSTTVKFNNKSITFTKGLDVSGDLDSKTNLFKSQISENKIIFFLFNAKNFVDDEIYRIDTLKIFCFVNRHCGLENKKLLPIGTYLDDLMKGKSSSKLKSYVVEIENELMKGSSNQNYEKLQLINLLDSQHIDAFKEKIFK